MARRGRPPTRPFTPVETKPLKPEVLAAAHAVATDDALRWGEASEAIGAIKSAAFLATVADCVVADKYRKLKESKSYVGMPYVDAAGKRRHVAVLEDLGELLGKSRRRLDELLSNRNLLGELYEQAEEIGLRQRDYNAIKLLPADDQAVIKRAIDSKADRETVIEQLVTLTERQAREKAALADEVAAKNKRIKALSEQRQALESQLEDATLERQKMTPDDLTNRLRDALSKVARDIRHLIKPSEQKAHCLFGRLDQLIEHGDALDENHRQFAHGIVAEIESDLQLIRDGFQLPGSRLFKEPTRR